jgi:hypothetical protein
MQPYMERIAVLLTSCSFSQKLLPMASFVDFILRCDLFD